MLTAVRPHLIGSRRVLLNIGTRGDIPTTRLLSANTNYESYRGRVKCMITADATRIRFVDIGYYLTTSEVDLGNDVPVSFALEITGAPTQVVAITYDGAASTIIPNGSAAHVSDWVYAASFGLAKFSAGMTMWRRHDARVLQGGYYLQHTVNSGQINGEGSTLVSAATPSNLMSTGTILTGNYSWTPLAILAEVEPTLRSVVGIGDSIITTISNDTYGDGQSGGGWFNRGLYSVNGRPMARMNLGRGSTQASHFVASNAKRRTLLKYANRCVTHYGTNDLAAGGRTAAQVIADIQSIAAIYKAEVPNGRFYFSKILPRCGTTDGGATTANQTPISGFEVGGAKRDAANDALVALAGRSLIDGIVDLNPAFADVSEPAKWKATYSTDCIHPSAGTSSAAGGTEFTAQAAWF